VWRAGVRLGGVFAKEELAVVATAVPAVAVFEVADLAVAAGSLFDKLAEAAAVLDGLASG
jgi:hypothetical protein